MKSVDVSVDVATDDEAAVDVAAVDAAVVAATLMADSSRSRARRAPECLQFVVVIVIAFFIETDGVANSGNFSARESRRRERHRAQRILLEV